MGARRPCKLGGLLGRQIDDQQAVDAGARGVGAQALASVVENRIVVAEQHDRNLGLPGAASLTIARIAASEAPDGQPARAARADWPARRPSDRKMARRVRSGRRRALPIRAPARAVASRLGSPATINGTSAASSRARSSAKFLFDSSGGCFHRHLPAHSVTPSARATVCMSLSPRPERLTTITLLLATSWAPAAPRRRPRARSPAPG